MSEQPLRTRPATHFPVITPTAIPRMAVLYTNDTTLCVSTVYRIGRA